MAEVRGGMGRERPAVRSCRALRDLACELEAEKLLRAELFFGKGKARAVTG